MTRSDAQLVEVCKDVKLGVELGLGESVCGFLDQWDWVSVFDSDGIELLLVNAQA